MYPLKKLAKLASPRVTLNTSDVREASYKVGDGLEALDTAAQTHLAGDKVALKFVADLKKAHSDFYRHLDRHYNWD